MKHPITPPPELVEQWSDIKPMEDAVVQNWVKIATQAARWGADQELESILEMVGFGQQSLPEEDRYLDGLTVASIRAARRPKPPSLKELALLQLDTLNADLAMHGKGCDLSQIRRALEALPND